MKVKKGEIVKVTVGKDRGKTGKIEKVLPKQKKVLVEGVNVYRKHQKPRGEKQPGGIIEINKPLPVANVALICPHCQQSTRVGFKFDRQGRKQRFCKKCQETFLSKKK